MAVDFGDGLGFVGSGLFTDSLGCALELTIGDFDLNLAGEPIGANARIGASEI
jgi:hypothetical protein